MRQNLIIAVAQLNPCVGDVCGNLTKAIEYYNEASAKGADLIIFPELFLIGYPPEDLVLKPAILQACHNALDKLVQITAKNKCAVLIGAPWADGNMESRNNHSGDRAFGYQPNEPKPYNAAILIENGKIISQHYKCDLPNYGVFDEKRLFTSGDLPRITRFRGINLGIMICEDIWKPDIPLYLAKQGADIFCIPNASPYRENIMHARLNSFSSWADKVNIPFIFVNQVGGQDELVFDGRSFVWENGNIKKLLPAFEESLELTHWQKSPNGSWAVANTDVDVEKPVTDMDVIEGDPIAIPYQACMQGLRDYVQKNGFGGVLIGLSGGIDSALAAAFSVDALGADRVHCVMMPSRYTSQESLDDATECAHLLGVRLDTISIATAMASFDDMLAELFKSKQADVTEENIQSRIRGLNLMALSNKFGHMLVTTGNKSEMAMGYATLYGDMCGGYNPLKDIYKTDVFRFARWRNTNMPNGALGSQGSVIPERIITKAPSAELRENQKDEDSLPPYSVLDAILKGLLEKEMTIDALVEAGHDRSLVNRIEKSLYLAEYKRRQSPPGPKIGPRNFGRDRRYPITNKFRDR